MTEAQTIEALGYLARISTAIEKLSMRHEPDDDVQFLTLEEAARTVSLSITTLRRAIKENKLKAHNVGLGKQRAVLRIDKDDLAHFIGNYRTTPAS